MAESVVDAALAVVKSTVAAGVALQLGVKASHLEDIKSDLELFKTYLTTTEEERSQDKMKDGKGLGAPGPRRRLRCGGLHGGLPRSSGQLVVVVPLQHPQVVPHRRRDGGAEKQGAQRVEKEKTLQLHGCSSQSS